MLVREARRPTEVLGKQGVVLTNQELIEAKSEIMNEFKQTSLKLQEKSSLRSYLLTLTLLSTNT
jgi:hypothetical protein